MTNQHLEARLQELTAELSKGQNRLHQLDQERLSIKNSMLRIDGAIQLLKELLVADITEKNDASGSPAMKIAAQ